MIRKLLVPLDGSPVAERALALADGLAETADIPIVLFAGRWDLDRANADRYLSQQIATMRHRDVETRVGLGESAPLAIIRELDMTPDVLAVMSSHGRTGIGQALLGSVTERVLRATGSPVLVVGPRWAGGELTKGSSLLVAVDGQVSADTLIGPVIDLAHMFQLHVWVVEVLEGGPPVEVMAQESAAVHQMAMRMREADVVADWEVLYGANPADELLRFADRNNVSVLALATRLRQGVKRVALGSVAMQVVRNAQHPVLLTRTPDHQT